MRAANLFDCFERHLLNLDILSEGNDLFVAKVVEDFILNLSGLGFTMGHQAEDIYSEIQGEVTNMLLKKIYGFYSVDTYRAHLRDFGPELGDFSGMSETSEAALNSGPDFNSDPSSQEF